jgi:hypothetical protein
MSRKNNVNPDHYKVAGRLRQGEDILHDQNKSKFSQATISLERKQAAWRPGTMVSNESKIPLPVAKSSGRTRSRQTRSSRAAAEDRARRSDPDSEQLSGKRGSRSSSRKQAASRHDTQPMPATTPAAGAFGRTGRLSETEEDIIQKEPAPAAPDDLIEKRKRQNRRDRK